jgi:hypothetical protein
MSHGLSRPVLLKEDLDPNDEMTFKEWRDTVRGKIVIILAKFLGVTFLGAFVFYGTDEAINDDDGEKENYEGRTFIDSMFFAVVIATSVGYGHELWPLSDSGKGFLIFYFFFATFIVGGLIGDIVDLYVNGVLGGHINRTIIDSTTWLHRADVDGDGKITEADYVLFKLQQVSCFKLYLLTLDSPPNLFCLMSPDLLTPQILGKNDIYVYVSHLSSDATSRRRGAGRSHRQVSRLGLQR